MRTSHKTCPALLAAVEVAAAPQREREKGRESGRERET